MGIDAHRGRYMRCHERREHVEGMDFPWVETHGYRRLSRCDNGEGLLGWIRKSS